MTWHIANVLAVGVTLALLAAFAAPAAAQRADFCVSPKGDDGSPGTVEKPFATLARARDAVRARIAAGLKADVLVLVRGGTYRIAGPIVFGPADSGTEKHSITYAAWPGEKPVISGGQVVTGWDESGPGTWRAEIPPVKAGKWHFNELYVNGERRPRARHPSLGYVRVAKVIDDRRSFQFAAGDLPKIETVGEAELVLLHDWSVSRTRLKAVDAAARTVTTAHGIGGPAAFWRINGFEPKPRYFIENHPDLLDAPGEWYLDRASGVLTYRPMPGEKIGAVRIVAPLAEQLLVIRGDVKAGKAVRNLRFVGLHFEHCAWSPEGVRYAGGQACFHWARPEEKGWGWQPMAPAVLLEHARNCRLEGGGVRHVGGCGIWLGRGCRDCAVIGSCVSDVAGNGVMLGEGRGAEGDDAAGGNAVTDCLVERCGVLYYGAVGVWVGLSGQNTIAHNEIRHHPYTGVSVGWMWNPRPTPAKANIVEHNHIHHVMQVLSDGGGIYTLGRQPGTVLRGNWIHDVPLNAGRAESNGMFLDEGTTDIVIENNLIHAVARSPLRFHKAGVNLVRNNHLVLGGANVPVVRYNATDSKNITLEGNTIIKPADQDGAELRKALERMRKSTGPRSGDSATRRDR